MPQVWLVNPIEPAKPARKSRAKRKKVKTATSPRKERQMAKKRRTAAQRAATKKMIAANRARRAGRKSPARKTKRRAARRSAPAAAAPRRSSKRRAARRSAPRRHRRSSARSARAAGRVLRYRRKNPVGFLSDFMSQLIPAAIGGAGALGVDVLMAVVPLPDSIKNGPFKPLVRVGAAIGLGMVAGMVKDKRFGNQVAAGALTVIAYDTMKGLLSKVAGGKIPGLGVYEIPGVGTYEVGPADSMPQVGYYDAGQQVGPVEVMPDESVGAYIH